MTSDVQHIGTVTSGLAEGDRLTIAATHQIRIDGMDSWVKVEVNSAVRPGEDTDAAFERIGGAIASRIVGEIERQAGVIVVANAKQK